MRAFLILNETTRKLNQNTLKKQAKYYVNIYYICIFRILLKSKNKKKDFVSLSLIVS
jgi:hypothetical protein